MLHTDLFGKLAGPAAGLALEKKCARQVFQTIRGFVSKLADDLRHRLCEGVAAIREKTGTIQIRFAFNTS